MRATKEQRKTWLRENRTLWDRDGELSESQLYWIAVKMQRASLYNRQTNPSQCAFAVMKMILEIRAESSPVSAR